MVKEKRVKINVTKSLIRGGRDVRVAVEQAILNGTGFPSWVYYPSGVIGIDDPITDDMDIVKVFAPRSVVRATKQGLTRGYSTVKPFSFFMPTKEVPNHYQVF